MRGEEVDHLLKRWSKLSLAAHVAEFRVMLAIRNGLEQVSHAVLGCGSHHVFARALDLSSLVDRSAFGLL